jgi:hypothetical protein
MKLLLSITALVLALPGFSLVTAGEKTYAERVAESEAVVHWSFDESVPQDWNFWDSHITRAVAPRPPEFPLFDVGNRSLDVLAGGYVRIPDEKSLRFTNGDAITIEAWVNVDSINRDANVYIVGKGRTHNDGYQKYNQNWALRLRDSDGAPSFLFATESEGENEGGVYHRWTAKEGIGPESGWHYVVIGYEFGKPESISGYVDAKRVKGEWDLGGETKRPPISDDDEIWLGGAMGGSESNALNGFIDEVAIYRRVVAEDEIKSKYEYRLLPPRAPVTEGRVAVTIREGLGQQSSWGRTSNHIHDEFLWDAFAFVDLPQKYSGNGLRKDRSNPFLLRASAMVTLPNREVTVLLRSRSAARLWIENQLVGENEFKKPDRDGHDPVPPHSKEHVPDLRLVGPGDRESLISFSGTGDPVQMVFETVVGGARLRQEVGEASVSVSVDGGPFYVLSADPQQPFVFPLTDSGWAQFSERSWSAIREINAERRNQLNPAVAHYWRTRHEAAAQHVVRLPPLETPDVAAVELVNNDVDRFIVASIERHNQSIQREITADRKTIDGVSFVRDVEPLLSKHCMKCHGAKAKGGLRLDSRERVLKGGESGEAAVAPGDPNESRLIQLVQSQEEEAMPPKGDRLSEEEVAVLVRWVREGATWGAENQVKEPVSVAAVIDEDTFRRRVALDTVGHPVHGRAPNESRAEFINRLVASEGWADHWTSYWQDVLAENPNILKPSLNNTGPFRWWIHESMMDNKSLDRFVTELIMMEGSTYGGGPGGFKLAKENDVPMAAKAHVIGTAFLGVEMKCARCHDAPFHDSKQADLFQMAAMLERKPLLVPESSSVPPGFAGEREPLIKVSLKPGSQLDPHWPFAALSDDPAGDLLWKPDDSRERLAAFVTAPTNKRFGKVLVNRLWSRLLGRGLVSPVDDWEDAEPSHPLLLDYLEREFVSSGYDLKHVARLILNSQTYQRALVPDAHPSALALFASGHRRRLSAEQIVDSMFDIVGKRLNTEELNFDIDGGRAITSMLSLGNPRRAWEFTSLSNERDRPSLALPKAQFVTDVLAAFGWRSSRPNPLTVRDETPNVLQPASLGNGQLMRRVVRLTDESAFTGLALNEMPVDAMVGEVFQRVLGRRPNPTELSVFTTLLSDGFNDRRVPPDRVTQPEPRKRLRFVSWSNHLSPEASEIKMEAQQRAREGEPPTGYLVRDWRERLEDMVWSLLNSPEILFVP